MKTNNKTLLIVGSILLIAGIFLSILNIGDDNTNLTQRAALFNAISLFLMGLGTILVGVFALKFLTKKK